MIRPCGLALLSFVLLPATPAAAADQYGGPPPSGAYVAAPPPVFLVPPCREAFWTTILTCVPRENLYPPFDSLHVQNQIRSLRPAARRPYVQVFKW